MSLRPKSDPSISVAPSTPDPLPWSSSAKAAALMRRYNALLEYLVCILMQDGYSSTEAYDEVLAVARLDPRATVQDFSSIDPFTDCEALLGFKAHNAIARLKRKYADKITEKKPVLVQPGANFLQLFNPVIQALKELGDSARPVEVRDRVAKTLWLSDKKRHKLLGCGTPQFDNRVAWVHFYLMKAGYIDSTYGGDWMLTEKGQSTSTLSHEEVVSIFKSVPCEFSEAPKEQEDATVAYEDAEEFFPPDGFQWI